MSRPTSTSRLWWTGSIPPAFEAPELALATSWVRTTVHVVRDPQGRVGLARDGEIACRESPPSGGVALIATLPPLYPEWLGDRSFCDAHGVRFPYIAGEMANGIASTRMVAAMGNAEMLGFFGAAGLAYARVQKAVDELIDVLGERRPWGVNIIHSPHEPALEEKVADLLIQRGVRRASASAFMALTPAIVRYAASGLHVGRSGDIRRKHYLFAKVSRPEVAKLFMSPAPRDILDSLVARGLLRPDEARLAAEVPLVEDVTVEADSGGHTDNRPLAALLPVIAQLRDEIVERHGYARSIRVGAAGGLGTPAGVAAAFALGAAYVMTGSVNQVSVESGLSDEGKRLLGRAGIADVVMAPSADMFELGVKVQVLKLGTMFGVRALRLYDLFQRHSSLDDLPAEARKRLEDEIFRAPLDQIWDETQRFWNERDPRELARARNDPRYRMALVFRWYLGKSSRWAIDGDPERKLDYQIWSGPAIGAFNAWTAGSFLANPEKRTVVQIARNLLEGAAVVTRAQQLRSYGVPVPEAVFRFAPRQLE